MSELKKIFKTIERGLGNKVQGAGIDITDLFDANVLNKQAGDSASIGAGFDVTQEKFKPIANLAVKKGPVEGAISAMSKDDIAAGLLYNTEDKSGALSFQASKSPEGNNFLLRGTKRFKTGGLLKQGKPKIALRGWK